MSKSKHYSINLPWMYLPCITFQKYIIGTPPSSRNYILNDVQVLCWTQGCSWSATASELSGARWIISHLNLFPQLSWYPWKKHWQRHNGPEGWILLTKVTPLGHSTKSNTNLDLTSSESRPSITITKHQQQNNDQTSASKSCLNINFKIVTKPWNLVLKVWTKT